MDVMPPPPSDTERHKILTELLKKRLDVGYRLLPKTVLTAVWIQVVITGALLKFALDADATPMLTLALCVLGALSSIAALVLAVCIDTLSTAVEGDIARDELRLGMLRDRSTLSFVRRGALVWILLNVALLLGWALLIYNAVRGYFG